MSEASGDAWTRRLATLFAEHPAWIDAASRLSANATSSVYFTHRAREPWRLETRDGSAWLLPGAAPDPDLVFRFSPESIGRLEEVEGGIGDFAVALFEQIVNREVDLRIRAGFGRLVRRGYVTLLVVAGPLVLGFGVRHGVGTLGALRRFVADLSTQGPAEWEREEREP